MTDDRRRDEAFKHLGSIVRELHEAMRELGLILIRVQWDRSYPLEAGHALYALRV